MMTVDGDLLYSCVKGAVRKLCVDGWYYFLRHTQEHEKYYSKNESAYIRALATAGICLDFETDASYFQFLYAYEPGSSRDYCYFDVLVDGCLTAHIGEEGKSSGENVLCVSLKPGIKRVQVYFPVFKRTRIGAISFKGETFVRLHANGNGVIQTFGDSITQGYDARYPSCTYNAVLARELDCELVNQSVAAAVFDPCTPMPLASEPRYLLSFYGTNDWSGRTRSDIQEAVSAYTKVLAGMYTSTEIYVITPIWRGDEENTKPCGTLADIREIIAEAAEGLPHFHVLRGETLMPHDRYLFGDGYLHPNELGFSILAQNIKRCITCE